MHRVAPSFWNRPGVRVPLARGCGAAIGLLLVVLPAMSGWSQSQSLDAVDVGQSRSLDDVEQATAGTPDGDRLAESESLDEVPAASAESPDDITTTYGSSLDSVPLAESGAPNNANLEWRPTPCSQMVVSGLSTPRTNDADAWRAALDEAEQRVRAAKQEVDQATADFGAALYRGEHLPATRVRLGEARDAAREQYSEVRCEMKASLEAARRAGVLPGVLRPYQAAADW